MIYTFLAVYEYLMFPWFSSQIVGDDKSISNIYYQNESVLLDTKNWEKLVYILEHADVNWPIFDMYLLIAVVSFQLKISMFRTKI